MTLLWFKTLAVAGVAASVANFVYDLRTPRCKPLLDDAKQYRERVLAGLDPDSGVDVEKRDSAKALSQSEAESRPRLWDF